MDDFNRKILSELQKDGRLSVTELSGRVGLSLSPCHRRVRALEEEGVIVGYRAQLNPSAIGLDFSAVVFATLREGDRQAVETFEAAVTNIAQVVKAERLFGDPDYMLHVICRNLADFQLLYDQRLSTLPGVLRLSSTLVMKTIVSERAFPI